MSQHRSIPRSPGSDATGRFYGTPTRQGVGTRDHVQSIRIFPPGSGIDYQDDLVDPWHNRPSDRQIEMAEAEGARMLVQHHLWTLTDEEYRASQRSSVIVHQGCRSCTASFRSNAQNTLPPRLSESPEHTPPMHDDVTSDEVDYMGMLMPYYLITPIVEVSRARSEGTSPMSVQHIDARPSTSDTRTDTSSSSDETASLFLPLCRPDEQPFTSENRTHTSSSSDATFMLSLPLCRPDAQQSTLNGTNQPSGSHGAAAALSEPLHHTDVLQSTLDTRTDPSSSSQGNAKLSVPLRHPDAHQSTLNGTDASSGSHGIAATLSEPLHHTDVLQSTLDTITDPSSSSHGNAKLSEPLHHPDENQSTLNGTDSSGSHGTAATLSEAQQYTLNTGTNPSSSSHGNAKLSVPLRHPDAHKSTLNGTDTSSDSPGTAATLSEPLHHTDVQRATLDTRTDPSSSSRGTAVSPAPLQLSDAQQSILNTRNGTSSVTHETATLSLPLHHPDARHDAAFNATILFDNRDTLDENNFLLDLDVPFTLTVTPLVAASGTRAVGQHIDAPPSTLHIRTCPSPRSHGTLTSCVPLRHSDTTQPTLSTTTEPSSSSHGTATSSVSLHHGDSQQSTLNTGTETSSSHVRETLSVPQRYPDAPQSTSNTRTNPSRLSSTGSSAPPHQQGEQQSLLNTNTDPSASYVEHQVPQHYPLNIHLQSPSRARTTAPFPQIVRSRIPQHPLTQRIRLSARPLTPQPFRQHARHPSLQQDRSNIGLPFPRNIFDQI